MPCACVLQVNKVAGNFHFAAGHSYQSGSMHIHDMAPFNDKVLDFTHKVHSLSFGQPYPVRRCRWRWLAMLLRFLQNMPAGSAACARRCMGCSMPRS